MKKRETIMFATIVLVLVSLVLLADYSSITGYAPYSGTNAIAIKEKLEKEPVGGYIQEASSRFNIDANLIRAIIAQESSGEHLNADGTVKHSACCWGIMQVGQSAFEDVKSQTGLTNFEEIKCPENSCIKNNILTGAAYLSKLEKQCDGMDCVIASYNAGPGCYKQGSSCSNYDFAVNSYLPSVKSYNSFFAEVEFTSAPESPLRYYLKPTFKIPMGYDIFAKAEELKKSIEAKKLAIIDCLKTGSGKTGDDDVKACAENVGVIGIDKYGEYYLKFDIEEEPPEGFSSQEKLHHKIALLLADDIPPPQAFLKQIIENNPKIVKFEIMSYASDTAGYNVYCNREGSEWSLQERVVTEEEVLQVEYDICGDTEGNYCFSVIAFDEVFNKIGDAPGVTFELGRNMVCEDIKRKCCKKDADFRFGTIDSCPSGYVEVGYDKCTT